jgi:hypothetical protein
MLVFGILRQIVLYPRRIYSRVHIVLFVLSMLALRFVSLIYNWLLHLAIFTGTVISVILADLTVIRSDMQLDDRGCSRRFVHPSWQSSCEFPYAISGNKRACKMNRRLREEMSMLEKNRAVIIVFICRIVYNTEHWWCTKSNSRFRFRHCSCDGTRAHWEIWPCGICERKDRRGTDENPTYVSKDCIVTLSRCFDVATIFADHRFAIMNRTLCHGDYTSVDCKSANAKYARIYRRLMLTRIASFSHHYLAIE